MKKLVIAVGSALLLSACGGNSNSYISAVSATGTPIIQGDLNNTLNPNSNSNLSPNLEGKKRTNNLNTISRADLDRSYRSKTESFDMYFLNKDGNEVKEELGSSAHTWHGLGFRDGNPDNRDGDNRYYTYLGAHDNLTPIGPNFSEKNESDSMFGLISGVDEDDNTKDTYWIGYAGGDLTEISDLPQTGVITYQGKALGLDDRTYLGVSLEHSLMHKETDITKLVQYGSSTIEVDFGMAKVKGFINYDGIGLENPLQDHGNAKNVSFNADIKDSYFFGRAENTAGDQGDLYGQFNGANAGELAGYYESDNPNGMVGSFAAAK